jgi:hypothetical protein
MFLKVYEKNIDRKCLKIHCKKKLEGSKTKYEKEIQGQTMSLFSYFLSCTVHLISAYDATQPLSLAHKNNIYKITKDKKMLSYGT